MQIGKKNVRREFHPLCLGHPNGSTLLLIDRVPQLAVPRIRIVEADRCAKHVRPNAFQLLALFKELFTALVLRLWQTLSQLFDTVLRICLQEDNDRVELCIVESIDGVRCDVEEGVLAPIHDVSNVGESHYSATFRSLIVVLQWSGIFIGKVLHKSFSSNVGDGAKQNDWPHESWMSQDNTFVGREL